MRKRLTIAGFAVLLTGSVSWVAAQQNGAAAKPETALVSTGIPAPATAADAGSKAKSVNTRETAPVKNEPAAERIEGEKRFHSNCGRCHQSPHKFPSREMATIVRHMRVRATITDEDMQLILKYMTQ